jgi:hypothetical protein
MPLLSAASDGSLPRTPMLYGDTACLVVVDRTRDPIVRLDYTIPSSDTCVGPHEAQGSRTHRHVALCRSPQPWEPLPHWLDPRDVSSSLDAGALAQQERPSDDDIMTSSNWADCHTLVGALEDRNPIHCTYAREGIEWDTRGLPTGAWVLAGYTYQPPLNMWSVRPGVFKVIDGSADAPPAVGLYPHSEFAGDDRPLELRVCIDAQPGSTVQVSAAPLGSEAPDWIEVASTVADDGQGELDVDLELGTVFDAATAVALRVEARDPSGRTFAYVSPAAITYVAGVTPSDPVGPEYDYCDEPAALQPQDCPPGTTPSTEGESSPTEGGCTGCAAGSRPLDMIASFMVLLAGLRPRRRSSAATSR